MRIIRRVSLSLVHFLIVLAFLLLQPEGQQQPDARAGRGPAGAVAQPERPGPPPEQTLSVGEPVTPGLSLTVRDLPQQAPEPQLEREVVPRRLPILEMPLDSGTGESAPDPLLARVPANTGASPAPLFTFEGLSGPEGGYYVPPDTIGEVGPNHYVQMVNAAFAVFDKTGRRTTGPVAFRKLFEGNAATPNCGVANDGDPIVVYDGLADRWLLSQFMGISTNTTGLCMAVSQTPDPTGNYYLYEFTTPEFPDYFKIGVWPDAYYLSANESTYTAYAFPRGKMLAGNRASFQRVAGESNLLLSADLDGDTPPPAGTPGYFYTFKDNVFHGGSDRLEIFTFDVDWNNAANTTFARVATIGVTPFTYTVCGYFQFECIPQPGSSQRVDSISEWPMWRLQYRNFGTHETLVGNFTVDAGSDRAGIRWFELRKGGGNWFLYQEGTHAPDSHHRWLGSIAMDGQGNIALGYSASSTSLYPSLRYATRLANDPLGSLQSEATLYSGSGAQISGSNGSDRWGDYSALVVDPADDCTFWYTNEYYTDISLRWRTRVGTFAEPSCGGVDLGIDVSDVPDPVEIGSALTYSLKIRNHSTIAATNVIVTDELPIDTTLKAFEPTALCQAAADEVVCKIDQLAGGAEATITVVVIPTQIGSPQNLVAVVAQENDPQAGNNEAIEITEVLGVGLTAPDGQFAQPGQAYTYDVQIVNTRQASDTFDLSISDHLWNTTLSVSDLTLASGETSFFTVEVQVPAEAQIGAREAVTVTARSRSAPAITDALTIVTVVPYPDYLPVIAR